MALAIYRKYRPKTFSDLLGQDHVVEVLKNAARQDRIAHAYLFYGPRGSGKTTAARLVAKVANCQTRAENAKFRATGEPCNRCAPCEEIDAGRALDVNEIDAASNRGIDEIRSLKESVKLSPLSYRYKVFIIDEAHQLTKEAFNALLKTLEEPPAHALFILATTEFEKVPATISSRAQRFRFRKLSIPEIIGKLKMIAKAEQLHIDADALELIAQSADGSVRDAESLADQLASLADRVTVAEVERIIGTVGFTRTAALAELMLKSDLAGTLAYIARVGDEGYNVTDLTRELVHHLRRAATLKFNPSAEPLFAAELTETELAALKSHSQLINIRHLSLIRALIRAYTEMRYAPFAAIPLEVAIIEQLQK